MDKVLIVLGVLLLFVVYFSIMIRAQKHRYEAYKSNLEAMRKIQGKLSAHLNSKENDDDNSK